MLIHHTNCGMQTITDDGFRSELPGSDRHRTRLRNRQSFTDVEADVAQSIRRVRCSEFIPTATTCVASSTTWKIRP